ncbi:hypothetical protein SAMN05660464_1989 [Geodermatophilus dictyosporus]|uniref:PAP2 superfamily protein n=1 Tax=Geodermatophilus dictyosporus TaxID=1523247 RepID=A0A1I5LY49_9ACTN|nr:hypothetical protein [Geodermatophilus dictyosporus]SFP02195.1 hypothetical protein SAMN05660464_1989 [Geodermatophilus dictyosporus]
MQRRTIGPRTRPAATLLSRAGEHAAAWVVIGLVGAALDARRRRRRGEAVLGVHLPSDVLSGTALGGAVAAPTRISRRTDAR